MKAVLITPNLDMLYVESEDGITWKVIPDEYSGSNISSGISASGSHRSASGRIHSNTSTDGSEQRADKG